MTQEFSRDLDFDMPAEVTGDVYSAMAQRLRTEIDEKDALVKALLRRVNADQRDLADDELEMLRECRSRLAKADQQLLKIQEAIRALST